MASTFADLNAFYHCDETGLVKHLVDIAQLSQADRDVISERAESYVDDIRASKDSLQLLDAFLQEYGLTTAEGVALMRLSEALIRTPDFPTARRLVRDKIGDAQWSDHSGASDRLLVNGATSGLQLSASWIKASGGLNAKRLAAKLGDRVLVKAVRASMALMGEHFVLGSTINQATHKAEENANTANRYSFDMLGESAITAKDAEAYFQSYTKAARHLARANTEGKLVGSNPSLSVKLSALHPRYAYLQRDICVPTLIDRLTELCRIAKSAGIGLTIDAEEADRLEVSLIIIEALIRAEEFAGWDGFGVVVQAYQRRATRVINQLIAMARLAQRTISVRLVKGAYWDMEIKRAQELGLDSYPVFTRKAHTDISYLACSRLLLDAPDCIFPQFATHNAHTATAIAHMATNNQRFEFQRLHGMGQPLHQRLMKDVGATSRIYAPVGSHKDLLPYLIRRLLENGANSSFVNQLFDEETLARDIVIDPIDLATRDGFGPDETIGAPRDLFAGQRLAARGIDLTQAKVAERQAANLSAQTQAYRAASLIDGVEVPGETVAINNPAATSSIVGYAKQASAECVERAMRTAVKSSWPSLSAADRAKCLRKAADLLEEDMSAFLKLCTLEAGKTLPDAIAEVREAIDFCRYYADQAQGQRVAGRMPLGVVACISPWNFPLAIFLGQIVGALSVGNTVIAKPAPQTPLIAYAAIKLLFRAGVDPKAVQLLIGGTDIGAALTAQPDIAGVCFTGSTATAKCIAATLADTSNSDIPMIAETGGINVMIIDSTALLEQAVQDVVASAFQSAGQRCSACRIVAVQDDIADAFIAMLAGAVDALSMGDPSDLAIDVGPVIDGDAHTKIAAYVEAARGRFEAIAEKSHEGINDQGHFVAPVAFEVQKVSDVAQEVFGPVLHMVRFKGTEIAALVSDINDLGFGLTMGLHTRIDERVKAFAAHAKVGNLYVNRNQIGAVVGVQPFGGEGLSGTGPKAGGPHYLFRLTRVSSPRRAHAMTAHEEAVQIPTQAALATYQKSMDAQKLWLSNAGQDARHCLLDTAFKSATVLAEDILDQLKRPQEIALPSPTGEDNVLRLHPRGIFLCLPSEDPSVAAKQLALALYAGNAVITSTGTAAQPMIDALRLALIANNAPNDIIVCTSAVNMLSLANSDIAGLITDRINLGAQWAKRQGSILPVLKSADEPELFYHERTLTVNTTAAGGNTALLSIAA